MWASTKKSWAGLQKAIRLRIIFAIAGIGAVAGIFVERAVIRYIQAEPHWGFDIVGAALGAVLILLIGIGLEDDTS